MTDTLVAFLRARLDEDERDAVQAGGKSWAWEQHYGDMCNDPTCPYGELATDEAVLMNVHGYDVKEQWLGAAHIARHDPARVLAEVEAKRRIVDFAAVVIANENGIYERTSGDHQYNTLRLLALPYADHPDYREEWRP